MCVHLDMYTYLRLETCSMGCNSLLIFIFKPVIVLKQPVISGLKINCQLFMQLIIIDGQKLTCN